MRSMTVLAATCVALVLVCCCIRESNAAPNISDWEDTVNHRVDRDVGQEYIDENEDAANISSMSEESNSDDSGCVKEVWIKDCKFCICSGGSSICTDELCWDDLDQPEIQDDICDNRTHICEGDIIPTLSPDEYIDIPDLYEPVTVPTEADLPVNAIGDGGAMDEMVNATGDGAAIGEMVAVELSFIPNDVRSCKLGNDADHPNLKYVKRCNQCNYCEDSCTMWHGKSCSCKPKFRCKKEAIKANNGTKGN